VGVWELAFVAFGICFFELLIPSTLRGHIFFNFISFLMIFLELNTPIGGVQVLFKHQKNGALPLDLACLEHLSVIVAIQL
jgi:hypothetical protein